MTTKPHTDQSTKAEIEAAKEVVGNALQELSVSNDRFAQVQQLFFDLEAARLARDDEFQEIDLSGNVHVPSSHRRVAPNPAARDELGEVELPTRDAHFSHLAGLQVADPDNPHTKHAVHVDNVIKPDGEVRVDINGQPLSELLEGEK